jgi:hypothetical protein
MNGNEMFGVWFNKRAVRAVELPFRHDLVSTDAGWDLSIRESGKLLVRYLDGDHQQFDVKEGDTLTASGEEMYLALQEAGGKGQEPRQEGAPIPAERVPPGPVGPARKAGAAPGEGL